VILGSSLYLSSPTDLIALLKPRVTALVIATTAGGLWLAPGSPSAPLVLWTLLGTVLLVGAANALNMYLERDTDALMARTRDRPLPAKRMSPEIALWVGVFLAVISLSVLAVRVNLLTGVLGLVAFVSYVLFYTPLKQKSHVALLIGAVPGAMPPLMGWTAATGTLQLPQDFPGFTLFAILFLWQIPHFLAIALFRKDDYEKAGIRIMPLTKGEEATKHMIVRYLAGLVAVSFYPVSFGMVGRGYLAAAAVSGLTFFVWGCLGFRKSAGPNWAKGFFLASIVYLPVLLGAMALSAHAN
jgi:protoheme IX farnesyltransferase